MRKSTIFTLTIALLASYSLQGCCTTCTAGLKVDDDKMTAETELPKVTILDAPKTDGFNATGFCGAIWTANSGTCCDQDSLAARQKAWDSRLNARRAHMKKSMDKLDEVMGKADKLALFVEQKRTELKESDKKLPEDDRRPPMGGERPPPPPKKRILAMDDTEVSDKKAIFEEFAKPEKLDKAKGRKDKAKGQMDACFDALRKFRYTGLCLRCSGAASDFYDAASGVYKVKNDVCPVLIKACGAVYGALFEANRMFDAVLQVKATLTDLATDTNVKDPAQMTRFPVDKTTADKWAKCADDVEACATGTDAQTLCADFTISLPSPVEDPTRADNAGALAEVPAARLLAASRILAQRQLSTRTLQDTTTDGYGAIQPTATGADLTADSAANFESIEPQSGSSGSSLISILASLAFLIAVLSK